MGLSGPKRKQRIGDDPQNKRWGDDKTKFGYKMMQKMGWNEGKGLGAKEDGVTEHVKIKLKEDNLGVGADKRTGDNWLENNSAFDQLLQSLNEGSKSTDEVTEEKTVEEKTVDIVAEKTLNFGRLYHRKKFLRNKRVSNYDSVDLQRILGVKPTDSAPETPEPEPESPPKVADPALAPSVVTVVSTSNVHEYFAQRMASLGIASAAASREGSRSVEDDEEERPMFGGLGFGAGVGLGSDTRGPMGIGFPLAQSSTEERELEVAETNKAKKEDKKGKKKSQEVEAKPEEEEPRKKKSKKNKDVVASPTAEETSKKDKKRKRSAVVEEEILAPQNGKSGEKEKKKKKKKEKSEKSDDDKKIVESAATESQPEKEGKKKKKRKKESDEDTSSGIVSDRAIGEDVVADSSEKGSADGKELKRKKSKKNPEGRKSKKAQKAAI
ncbi:PIN2/TERF1-interacting telomerase inhibitor 1 [Borealophlyctis nickersoniae]|nr:PIN2/TERF1-interacting telomerase inhibitor 1 [Borealophlyctis nickersoniae]